MSVLLFYFDNFYDYIKVFLLESGHWNIKGKRLSVSNLLSGDSEINYIYIKW